MSGGHVESFRSHANYLRAFALLCSAPYQPGGAGPFPTVHAQLARLAPAVAGAPSMAAPTAAAPDLTQARKSLQNAWGTELLLAFGGKVASDEELLRLMNNWGVVQAYYVGYHSTQALIVSRGQQRPESHPKTQAQFATLWADRPLALPPWSLAAHADGWRNPPPRPIDDSLSPWARCDEESCWDLAAKVLRTTRDEKVAEALGRARGHRRTERRKAWEEEERDRQARGLKSRKVPTFPRPQLRADEKRAVSARVRSYTILDYLYRLRVKTNYEDAGMFIDGPEDTSTSSIVHRDLVTISSCTLLAHELHIGAIVGRRSLLSWVDEWIARNAAGGSIGLGIRRELLNVHLS